MDQTPTVTLLFASDDPGAVRASDPVLAEQPDIEIVATATSGSEAINMAALYQPDVVVIDYDMPEMNTATIARSILQEAPGAQIIMLSLVNDAADIRQAMRAGARDYLVKPLQPGELVDTARWLLREKREYARMQAFVKQLRRAYEALFTDDKPVPPKVVAFLESQAAASPDDHLTQEALAVAYARNRDWRRLAPLARRLGDSQVG